MQIFYNRYFSASVLYAYKDELYISALSDKELVKIFADYAMNPEYNYIANLFKYYYNSQLSK